MTSSAKYFSYELRPSKQLERRMISECLLAAAEAGLISHETQYIGFGGVSFYDFIVFHKQLNLINMTSLEADENSYARSEFNKPYDFIHLFDMSSNDFLVEKFNREQAIFWFDYDSRFGDDSISDINSLGALIAPDSFVFTTFPAEPWREIGQLDARSRLDSLMEQFGALAGSVSLEEVQDRNFYLALHKIICAAFQNAFAARTGKKIFLDFRAHYKDSTRMITIGGYFGSEENYQRYRMRATRKVPFLFDESADNSVPYKIPSFYMTHKEKFHFDLAATGESQDFLQSLGFKHRDIRKYTDVYRLLPRYVETLI